MVPWISGVFSAAQMLLIMERLHGIFIGKLQAAACLYDPFTLLWQHAAIFYFDHDTTIKYSRSLEINYIV